MWWRLQRRRWAVQGVLGVGLLGLVEPAIACSGAEAPVAAPIVDADAQHKITPTLNAQWAAARGWVRRQQWVECLVKVEGRMDAVQARQLRYAGFVSRSVLESAQQTATILTGHLRLADLLRVAKLPFVQVVEGAAVVGAKTKPVNVGK